MTTGQYTSDHKSVLNGKKVKTRINRTVDIVIKLFTC